MNELTDFIKDELLRNGADLVGIGDLSELPPDAREEFPIGISIAVKYPDIVIQGIADLPTAAYNNWYIKLNDRLDSLATLGAESLKSRGYSAIAMTRAHVGSGESGDNTVLPHKTVATRAGLGWIGKSALLVTDQFGSMIRISSILTDAPLICAEPVNQSKCGDCMICTDACPARAVSGKIWSPELFRDEFFDSVKCRKTAKERAFKGHGGSNTICGKCIEVCPYTRKAWK